MLLAQHEPLLCQSLSSNGRHYNHQQHEPLLFLLAIVSTISVLGLTVEWFILFLFCCLPLLLKV
jgi:hypothetical protein